MASPPSDFSAFIAMLARELTARDLAFMLIGGQAVLLHGTPRLTEDVDVTLGVGPERIADVLELCADSGLVPLADHPEQFARETFVVPARHVETAMRVDFILSTTPYERQAIERAVPVDLEGQPVPFASAEDLVLHKLFAGRARDWEDAVSVARRKGSEIDWGYVERWAGEFAAVPGREALPDQVERLRREAG